MNGVQPQFAMRAVLGIVEVSLRLMGLGSAETISATLYFASQCPAGLSVSLSKLGFNV